MFLFTKNINDSEPPPAGLLQPGTTEPNLKHRSRQELQSSTKVLGTPGSDNWNMRLPAILETIANGITGKRSPLPPDNVGNEQ